MYYFQVKIDILLKNFVGSNLVNNVIKRMITFPPLQWLLKIQTYKKSSFSIMLKPLVGVSLFLPPL